MPFYFILSFFGDFITDKIKFFTYTFHKNKKGEKMSTLERVIRIVLALAVFGIVGGYFGSWWALVGLIPLLTGIFKVCPIRVWTGKQACPLGVCPISKKKN